jgi:hypothetical protein
MNSKQEKTSGQVSVLLAILGVLTPFIIPVVFPSLRDIFWTYGPVMIWMLQLVSFIVGFVGRRSMLGKVGMILAVLFSIILLGYLSFG